MIRNVLLPATLAACLSLAPADPAAADPTVGLGLTFAFGGGGGEWGLGLRVLSDNRRDRVVGAVGFDYMFGSGRLRPSLGVAYLGSNGYVGVDLGYDVNRGALDFGISAGGANTKRRPAPALGGGVGEGGGGITPVPEGPLEPVT
jgi:hypothetical protein